MSTNKDYSQLIDALHAKDSTASRERARDLLYMNTQDLSDGQRVCVDRVIAAVDAARRVTPIPPAQQLRDIYQAYIAMQACYENRKEFRVQYVTRQELDAARSITQREEQSFLQKVPSLTKQKDQIWEQAKKLHLDSELNGNMSLNGTAHNSRASLLCRTNAIRFTADKGQQQQTIKKDF